MFLNLGVIIAPPPLRKKWYRATLTMFTRQTTIMLNIIPQCKWKCISISIYSARAYSSSDAIRGATREPVLLVHVMAEVNSLETRFKKKDNVLHWRVALARVCGTVCHRTYDKTWTSRVSSINWKHFRLGVTHPRRIVTVCYSAP